VENRQVGLKARAELLNNASKWSKSILQMPEPLLFDYQSAVYHPDLRSGRNLLSKCEFNVIDEKMSRLKDLICRIVSYFGSQDSPFPGRLWVLFWIYPAIMAVIVQLIILPYIFPEWHDGGGLLIQGDSQAYHWTAVEIAENIHDQGWLVWNDWLREMHGFVPAYFAAAVYAVTIPELWTLIPMNAALHASATLLLFLIVKNILRDWRMAIMAVLPFWLFPSAMNWYAQIHKDGISIFGTYLILYGCAVLAQNQSWKASLRRLAFEAVWLFAFGAGLVWVVRPFLLNIILGISVLLGMALIIVFCCKGPLPAPKWRLAFLLLITLVVVIIAIDPGIPLVDKGVGMLQHQRDKFTDSIYGKAISAIDINVNFDSLGDVMRYLPRATQIAFLSPFPNFWLGQGSLPQTSYMRRVVALEMIVVYFSLLGLPWAVWRWRRSPEFWMVLLFPSGLLIVYSLVVANIGTLYRYRYGFTMLIVALGIAGWCSIWEWRRNRD
jgi:putative peptidoglycan lipid II flippase